MKTGSESSSSWHLQVKIVYAYIVLARGAVYRHRYLRGRNRVDARLSFVVGIPHQVNVKVHFLLGHGGREREQRRLEEAPHPWVHPFHEPEGNLRRDEAHLQNGGGR